MYFCTQSHTDWIFDIQWITDTLLITGILGTAFCFKMIIVSVFITKLVYLATYMLLLVEVYQCLGRSILTPFYSVINNSIHVHDGKYLRYVNHLQVNRASGIPRLCGGERPTPPSLAFGLELG